MTRRGQPTLPMLLTRLDQQVALLHGDFGGLPRDVTVDDTLRDIWLEDTFHSSKLEGNTLSKRQVQRLLDEGDASGPLADVLAVQGYAMAASWVYRHARSYALIYGVPLKIVAHLHQLLLGPAWQVKAFARGSKPGTLRQQPSRISGSLVRTTLPTAIETELNAWTDHTRGNHGHPLAHAAEAHAWFERIHPFADGNGRLGRLLITFMLLQRGYPPAVIESTVRDRYLSGLARADVGQYADLTELIARALEDSLNKFLGPRQAGEDKLVPLSQLAEHAGYEPAYLRSLANQGRLRAVREGRVWLSTTTWVDEYKASRSTRGRKSSLP